MPFGDVGSSEKGLIAVAVLLAVLIFVFPLAVPFPLLDPDEGLHASIAQEMVERGDWATPRLLGEPFLDKPVLYFWLQAASIWLFGSNEAAVRLPGLMCGLLGAMTTGLLGWRLFDAVTGLVAGILYATTILPTALAQAASHDVALIPCINLVVLLLWEAERGCAGRRRAACILAAGVVLGLAVLTKGLFGVAAVAVAYGGYLVLARRLTRRVVLRGMAVMAIAVLIAAPWYAWLGARHPNYLRYFFLERHLLGFATDSQPHGDGPWWYYLPVLLGGGLPWIGYLPAIVRDGWAARGNRVAKGDSPVFADHGRPTLRVGARAVPAKIGTVPVARPMLLLWAWLIGWTVLMMLAGSKLATYMWPVFPPIAILAATAWRGLMATAAGTAAPHAAFSRTFVSSTWTGPIVLPAAVLAIQIAFGVHFAWPVWLAVAVVAIASPFPLVFWHAGRWQAALTAAVTSVALQFLVIIVMVVPTVAGTFSAREVAQHFNALGRLPRRLLVADGRIGSLVFYLDPRLRAGIQPDQFQQSPANKLPPLVAGDVVAVPQRKLRRFRQACDLDGSPHESVGSYELYYVDDDRTIKEH